MAVDMVLWALLAAMAGFLAFGCRVTRKTTDGRQAGSNIAAGRISDRGRLLSPSHRAGETLGFFGGAE